MPCRWRGGGDGDLPSFCIFMRSNSPFFIPNIQVDTFIYLIEFSTTNTLTMFLSPIVPLLYQSLAALCGTLLLFHNPIQSGSFIH